MPVKTLSNTLMAMIPTDLTPVTLDMWDAMEADGDQENHCGSAQMAPGLPWWHCA